MQKLFTYVQITLFLQVSSNINTEKVSLLRLELFNIPLEDMKQTKCRTLEYLKNIRDDIISLNMDKIKSDVMENLQIDEEITGKKVHADISSKLYPVSIYLDTDEVRFTCTFIFYYLRFSVTFPC